MMKMQDEEENLDDRREKGKTYRIYTFYIMINLKANVPVLNIRDVYDSFLWWSLKFVSLYFIID